MTDGYEEQRFAEIRERAKDRFGELLLTKGSTGLLVKIAAMRRVSQEIDGRGGGSMDDALDEELARRRREFN